MKCRLATLFVILAALVVGACGGGGPPADSIDLEECADDADSDEIDDQIAIYKEFESSAHEMVVCGSLTMQFQIALFETLVKLAQNPDAETLDDTFEYTDGSYFVHGEGVEMRLRVYFGDDYDAGDDGARISPNLFIMDSYLVGANVDDLDDESATISYDSTGPLVELMGQGASPPNPIVIEYENPLFLREMNKLKVKSKIEVDDEVDLATFTYLIPGAKQKLETALLGLGQTMIAEEATGTRADIEQTMETVEWDVDYVETSITKGLDGTIIMNFNGGLFPFQAEYDYDPLIEGSPEVTVRCQDE